METEQENQPINQQTKKKPIRSLNYLAAFGLLMAFLALLAWGLRQAQQGPMKIGAPAPSFELISFEGETINTADLSGKVIVVNFWASWCQPCKTEAAEMEEAWRLYNPSGEVIFLGVDYVDTEPEALRYIEEFDITYPNGVDLRSSISDLFRIRGVPETFIIDRSGNLAYMKIGPFSGLDEIMDAVDRVSLQE